jgi:hypothetical protein
MAAVPSLLIKSWFAVHNGGNRHEIAIRPGKFRFFSLFIIFSGSRIFQKLFKQRFGYRGCAGIKWSAIKAI